MTENEINNEYFKKVVEHFGSQVKLASMLNIHRQTIHNWYSNRANIPILYALKIEHLTDGKFKHMKLIDKDTRCYLKKK